MNRTLGVDFGRKRVGLAISDPLGITAQPLEVVPRGSAVERVAEVLAEYQVGLIVVGLPTPLGGGDTDSTTLARELGDELAEATGVEVVYVDERFTSKMAEEALLESGMRRQQRREKVDKVAAAIILQTYLDGNFHISDGVEETGAQ